MEASSNEGPISEMTQDLELKLKFTEEHDEFHEDDQEFDENDEEEVEDEFSFDFAFDGLNPDQISAEEAFDNGQIKPVFPLFNRDLLLDEEELENLKLNDRLPNVKKVFVEANDNTTPSGDDDDSQIVGPYCEWSKKPAVEVVEQPPEGCKKSNSTGFSKIWRFKDFMHRSNSDGRDAFVFLNNTTSSGSTTAATKEEEKPENKVNVGVRKVNGERGIVGGEGQVKKGKKVIKGTKKAALSPHEMYLRSKAKEGGRRSYLPYRPELVGFFTNVNGGGLTRNVHPF